MEEPLSPVEVRVFQHRLLSLLTSLSGEVEQLEGAALEPSGGTRFQDVDESIEETALADDLGSLAAEDELGYEVREALERVAGDTYGVCESCGEWIARRRLEVLPYARECADCAHAHQSSA